MSHTACANLILTILDSSHSNRSRQSSLALDRDSQHLLESTPLAKSELKTAKSDKGFIKSVKNLRRRLRGWRFGVLLASAMSSFVLVTNCIAAITIHLKYGTHDGVSTAFEGDCDVVSQWSLGLHIVINILSSLLLSASNYTMQVLNAPTRSECDKAHVHSDWLDIGITSLRNITRITWPRRVLWLLLGFSSVPIHLFYNSAAFKTIDTNAYLVVVATPVFLSEVPPPEPPSDPYESGPYSNGSAGYRDYEAESLQRTYHSEVSEFSNLTAVECINTYGIDFVTGYSDVIALTSGPYPANASFAALTMSSPRMDLSSIDPYAWYAFSTLRTIA